MKKSVPRKLTFFRNLLRCSLLPQVIDAIENHMLEAAVVSTGTAAVFFAVIVAQCKNRTENIFGRIYKKHG